MKKFIFFILFIPVLILATEIPDIYNYYPIPGDRIDIYLVDHTTLRSYSYSTYIEYDYSMIIKILDLERKSPMMGETESQDPEYIPWKLISMDNMNMRDIASTINSLYKDEFDVDTVYVTVGAFGKMNNIAVTIGSGKTNYVHFNWGKTYRYYINYVEARSLKTEPSTLYIIHEGSSSYDMKDLDDIALPQDQIFLYPHLVNVGGHVNIPGVYNYAPGFTFMDYIGLAGGVGPYGTLSRVYVYNSSGHKVGKNEEIKPGYSISVGRSFMGIMTDVSVVASILLGIYSVFSITTSLIN